MAKHLFLLFTTGCLLLAGCSSTKTESTQATESATTAQQDSGAKRYQLKGKVVSIGSDNKQMVVNGEAIPGFMDAMAMPYAVKDTAALSNVKAGDQITADVLVNKDGAVLDNIKVVSKGATK
jgi:protein SCO1